MSVALVDAAVRAHRRIVLTVAAAGFVAVGLIGGLVLAKLADDPHTARSEAVTGTVTWSNDQTRLIAFEQDGVRRDPLEGDAIYTVIADNWQDSAGTSHGDNTYPSCLAGEKDDPVSMDRHQVELDVIHRTTGGGGGQHIALQVHCLD